jgi:hypothetical protein
MLIKIDRQEAITNFPILPLRHYDKKKDEEVFNSPQVFASYILTLPSKSYRGHQKLLGAQITELVKNIGYDHLIFLGDIDIAWLRRFDTNELPTFLKHLSWLVRTNGVLPYVHFTDPGQNIVGEICQYGNLHISTKTKAADKRFKDIVTNSRFTYLTDKNCINKFSKKNVIKGRTITM